MKTNLKVVTIGGGTGSFTVLSGLKKYPLDLTAIVTMADDGGSTGVLRDELGVLPPGDVRQCLVALSKSDLLMRELMNYRFTDGKLKGHNFGNLLLSALEKVTGSFDLAVEKASEILRISGHVIPATLDKVSLVARLKDGAIIHGQSLIHKTNLQQLDQMELIPSAQANPKAVAAIQAAKAIIIGPGDFYSSLIPNLLVKGIVDAIQHSSAKKIFVTNLMAKKGHTEGFSADDFAQTIERYLGCKVDTVLYNTFVPSQNLLERYARNGEVMIKRPKKKLDARYVGADLVSRSFPKARAGDPLERTYIRHDPDRLANIIHELLSPLI